MEFLTAGVSAQPTLNDPCDNSVYWSSSLYYITLLTGVHSSESDLGILLCIMFGHDNLLKFMVNEINFNFCDWKKL